MSQPIDLSAVMFLLKTIIFEIKCVDFRKLLNFSDFLYLNAYQQIIIKEQHEFIKDRYTATNLFVLLIFCLTLLIVFTPT